jgi:hypothetical protein
MVNWFGMETLGLERLLAPRTIFDFFGADFQKRPFAVQGRGPSLFAGLVSLEQIEHAIDAYDVRDGKCRLMGQDEASRRTLEKSGELNDVLLAYGRGASINLGGLDRRCPAVGELRRQLRKDFASHGVALSSHGDSVVFVTPANSQAIKPHVDPDDLFVLQLEGRKRWKVFARDPHWRNRPEDQLPAAALETELLPGDLLYIPQHWILVASAGDEFSFALTVGFRPVSWADTLTSLSGLHLFGLAPLFEALPPWAVPGGHHTAQGRGHMTRVLRGLLDTPEFQRALEELEIKGFSGGRSEGIAAVNRTRCLDAETLCTLSGPSRVERHDDAVEIFTGARRVRAPLSVAPALRWISEQPGAFLVGAIGGALTDTAKVVLARRLVLEGILQLRAGEITPPAAATAH